MLPADDTQGHVTDRILHLNLHGSDFTAKTGCCQEHIDAITSTHLCQGLEGKIDELVVEVCVTQGREQPVIALDAPRRSICPTGAQSKPDMPNLLAQVQHTAPRTSRPGVRAYPVVRLAACGRRPEALQRQLWLLQDKVQVQQSLDAGIRGKNLLSR